jgi:hypothetical protein
MKTMSNSQSITDIFYIIYTYSEDETFVHEDYNEEIFSTKEAALEYALQRTEEDGEPRIVVRCEAVSSVAVPKPVVQVRDIKAKK